MAQPIDRAQPEFKTRQQVALNLPPQVVRLDRYGQPSYQQRRRQNPNGAGSI
jgi:hypothetical protein